MSLVDDENTIFKIISDYNAKLIIYEASLKTPEETLEQIKKMCTDNKILFIVAIPLIEAMLMADKGESLFKHADCVSLVTEGSDIEIDASFFCYRLNIAGNIKFQCFPFLNP